MTKKPVLAYLKPYQYAALRNIYCFLVGYESSNNLHLMMTNESKINIM